MRADPEIRGLMWKLSRSLSSWQRGGCSGTVMSDGLLHYLAGGLRRSDKDWHGRRSTSDLREEANGLKMDTNARKTWDRRAVES